MIKKTDNPEQFAVRAAAILIALLMALMVLDIVAKDASEFHTCVNSGWIKSPWYSPNWLEQPYTNLRLALLPKHEYWTENGVHTERWLVREVAVGETVFWTPIKRVPKVPAEAAEHR